MLRKIIFSTTALLSSQLTKAAQNESVAKEGDIGYLLFFGAIGGMLVIKVIQEHSKLLPIWTYLYYRTFTDEELTDEFKEWEGSIDGLRAELDDLRECENQLERRGYQSPENNFDFFDYDPQVRANARWDELERFKRQKYPKYYEFLHEEKKSENQKRYKPHKRERAKLRAKKFFDLTADNSSSEVLETKRNTNS